MLHQRVIDAPLVQRLVSAQFPQWAGLAVQPVLPGGWDHRTFRLGEQLLVRLPSAADYAAQVEKEQRWLPILAPRLPLPIPTPVAIGEPALGYPWRWSVYRWIDGQAAAPERIADLRDFAGRLAQFLVALQHIDASGGPAPGLHNFHRGSALANYDPQTRQAIAALQDRVDADAATAVWEAALWSPCPHAPVWVHGDVAAGNLLVQDGCLSAVIDFGNLATGDPACDLVIAWTLFEGDSREAFRRTLALDDATWARARGWALWKALIVAAGLAGGDAAEAARSWRVIETLCAGPCATPGSPAPRAPDPA